MAKKDSRAKPDKKKGRRRDTAHAVLEVLVERGAGSDVAALCRSTDSSLGEVLRSVVDLQRFGLVEVTNGISRSTPLGAEAVAALAERAKKKPAKASEERA